MSLITKEKQCRTCKAYKSLNEFYKKGFRHDSHCKSCMLLKKKTSRNQAHKKFAPGKGVRITKVLPIHAMKVTSVSLPERNQTTIQLEGLLQDLVRKSFNRNGEYREL
ncbi:hypothetical protein AZI86_07105 [Bdellovibrio bacteriovorus]|uniref:Uncharacterized protein n=1 Tax=Bdellovibrio bacteriovorus TaxID=959 RepID=A0A150WQX5_BDEBC|nr:hypothetical protein AZI86_07105 [Bdellovibrio bacteriovorus]